MLPLNYKPRQIVPVVTRSEVAADKLFEKVYLHLNKPFFYPGEIIWFKGYMNYQSTSVADSLSTVLYVDLINAEHKIVQSKVLRIDSGRVMGNLILPLDIAEGNYLVSAYTNWMRNYGEQAYFVQIIPVLNIYDRPLADCPYPEIQNSSGVIMRMNKDKYSLRELVKVDVLLKDELGNPVNGNLSVSVTDVVQVPDVPWANHDIRRELTIPPPEEMKIPEGVFKNRVEYGISWTGEFQYDQKKKELIELTVVRGNFDDVMKVKIPSDGKFTLHNMDIQDSALFSFQALRGDESFGHVKPLASKRPIISFPPFKPIVLGHMKSEQRNLSGFEIPNEAVLLKSVEVKSSRLQYAESGNENIYGKGETTITSTDILKYNSMQQLLQAKAAGFKLLFEYNHWRLRSTRLVAPMNLAPAEPLLIINNNQVLLGAGETVGDRLLSLSMKNIERIEVNPQSNSFGFANSSFGLIAVFMKNGRGNSRVQHLYIKGYDSFKDFKGPDYALKSGEHDRKDLRSTLYWNNNLNTNSDGESNFSFYTADAPGEYRIVIEGMTEHGTMVHFEKRISIEPE